ncbi:TPA: hypothetical protein L4559_003515 [Pseudomonas aeruginosa]|nr:hypothetical protein [Pseudomonas aeruginosa]
MDLIAQLDAAGLQVVSGNMRLQAALSAGIAVEATDGQGNYFRIAAQGEQVSVEKLENSSSQGLASVLVKSIPRDTHVTEIPQIPVSSLTPCPANARLNTFSFRAEGENDVVQFLAATEACGFTVQSSVQPDADGLPDVDVEIQTSATLEQLRDVLRKQEDSHVMLQTLRQLPLELNSLERDYDPAEPRWISTSDFEAAMVRPKAGTHFTEPMLGRAADGEEIPFVTATSSSSGISWSKNVVEVLVEPRNRARGWLARPLW